MLRSKWLASFRQRQECPNSSAEDVPAIDTQSIRAGGDPIRTFMEIGDSGATHRCPQADLVVAHFEKAERSRLPLVREHSQPVALVYDHVFRGESWESGPSNGAFTADQLCSRLRAPRPRYSRAGATARGKSTPQVGTPPQLEQRMQPKGYTEGPEPNTERRIVFITDLDKRTASAVASAAPANQVTPLQNALYRHCAAGQNYIGMAIPPLFLPIFELAFHLPLQSWQLTRGSDIPRGSRDVAFLDLQNGERAHVCTAKFSCVVTGIDEWRWIAYCFIDTLYDPTDDRESVEDYVHDGEGMSPFRMAMDPCTHGRHPLEPPVRDPRKWFLMVLEARLLSSNKEWLHLIHKIEESIESFEEKIERAKDISSQQMSDWIYQTRGLLSYLSRSLDRTQRTLEDFDSTHADVFEGHHNQQLMAIQGQYQKLKDAGSRLREAEHACNSLTKDLNFRMRKQQQGVASDSRAISIILVICSPFILTSGIFSMEDNVRRDTFGRLLPHANPAAFACVLCIFTVILFLAALGLKLVRIPVLKLPRFRGGIHAAGLSLSQALHHLPAERLAQEAQRGGRDVETGPVSGTPHYPVRMPTRTDTAGSSFSSAEPLVQELRHLHIR